MASLVVRPAVVDFVDTLMRSDQGAAPDGGSARARGAPLTGLAVGDLRATLEIEARCWRSSSRGGAALANPSAADDDRQPATC